MAAIHMLGGTAPGRKTFSMKSEVHGRTVDFIPERGMITIRIETGKHGADSEQYERVSCATFAGRIRALRGNVLQLIRWANEDSGRARRHRQEALTLQRMVDCMVQALKAASDQGDPVAGLLRQAMDQSAIRRPTYETPVSSIPVAPSSRPCAPAVASSDPSKMLVLPSGRLA